MTDTPDAQRTSLTLSTTELRLVVTALRLLLSAEDDAVEIERLKDLIERLEAL